MVEAQQIRNRLLTVIAFILVVAALRVSFPVTMPIAVAAFVVAAIWPIMPWMDRVMPTGLGYPATVLMLFVVLAGFIIITYFAIMQTAQTLASQQDAFRGGYDAFRDWAREQGLPLSSGEKGFDRIVAVVRTVFGKLYTVLGYLGIISLLIIMGLPEVRMLTRRLRSQLDLTDQWEMVDTVQKIGSRFREYIGIMIIMSLISGVASGLWAFAVGLDLALTWGVLNFLLNFVPVIGNIIGIIPPTLYAVMQFDGWVMPVIVFTGFAILQVTISNVVYPMWQGRGMEMPPVMVVVALLFWGWVWGIVGALLAVPLTAAFFIVAGHFKSIEWASRLLSRRK